MGEPEFTRVAGGPEDPFLAGDKNKFLCISVGKKHTVAMGIMDLVNCFGPEIYFVFYFVYTKKRWINIIKINFSGGVLSGAVLRKNCHTGTKKQEDEKDFFHACNYLTKYKLKWRKGDKLRG